MVDLRIWPSTDGPDVKAVESEFVTLGLKVRCTAPGVVLKRMFYYRPADLLVGTRRAVVYQVGNTTPLLNELYPDTDGTGFKWQSFVLSSPLALTNGQDYYFCTTYSQNGGGYAATQFYFDTGPGAAGFNLGGMAYVYHGGDITPEPGQSVYVVTTPSAGPGYPVNSFRDTNYWTDIEIGTVTTEVTKSLSTQWNVSSPLAKSLASAWGVGETLTSSLSARWTTLAGVGINRNVFWFVYRPVSLVAPVEWAVNSTLLKSLEVNWGLGGEVRVSRQVFWGALESLDSSSGIDWAVLEAVPIDRDMLWAVLQAISDSDRSEWSVSIGTNRSIALRWNTNSNLEIKETRLKLYINGAWVRVPVKVHNGTSWVEVPVRSYDGETMTWV